MKKRKIFNIGWKAVIIWLIIFSIVGGFLYFKYVKPDNVDKLYQLAMKRKVPIILYFYSTKCPICNSITGYVVSIGHEYADYISMVPINVGKTKNYPYAAMYHVNQIPFFVVMNAQKQVIMQGAGILSYDQLISICEMLKNEPNYLPAPMEQ